MDRFHETRTEEDFLGDQDLPAGSLSGIHSFRAMENFDEVGGRLNRRLIRAYGLVKLACLRTNEKLGYIKGKKAEAIAAACEELAQGMFYPDPIPAALQGGAGTSTNMYVNEIIANRALQRLGKAPGDYEIISPLNDVNLHQSTNDTYPTSVRVAALMALEELEEKLDMLTRSFQEKEKEFEHITRLARTQLQDAVPTTLGRQMGAYAEAFSNDRWRIYKAKERLRTVNLGGTAIGTGLGAPQKYIFQVVDELRKITNLPIARSENLVQATQNCDLIVETSGFLKTLGVNLFKAASDLRLLSSGPNAGLGEIKLPPRQAGSSIMPGKVNPVIAEMVCQVAMTSVTRDAAIAMATMNGQLELNAFWPMIADNLLRMLDELIFASWRFAVLLVRDMTADPDRNAAALHSSTAVITAFVQKIGYDKASKVAARAHKEGRSIKEILLEEKLCTPEEYDYLTGPDAALALGFRE